MSNNINRTQGPNTVISSDPAASQQTAAPPATSAGIGATTNFNAQLQQASNLQQDGNPDDALAGQKLQDQTEEKIAAAAAAEKARHDMIMQIISDVSQAKDTA